MRRIDLRIRQLVKSQCLNCQEPLQVVHYANRSQHYWSHHDYFEQVASETNLPGVGKMFVFDFFVLIIWLDEGSNRLLTLFLYLNDVEEGGATIFSHAGTNGFSVNEIRHSQLKDCSRGLKIAPKKGKAALWYNLKEPIMRGSVDLTTRHGGCPPLVGEKWGANRWIWNWVPEEGGNKYSY
jgi:prolyl 4-hydroxylase